MLRRGCPLHANKAPARETNHYALVCMRARRRVEVYVIGDLLGPPPGELAEPITLRDKLACVWKQLLAAPSQISVAVDLRSMTK
jgi:hypothetical protein